VLTCGCLVYEIIPMGWLALFSSKVYCCLPHITIFTVKKEEVTW
jgi:hypothetical protein